MVLFFLLTLLCLLAIVPLQAILPTSVPHILVLCVRGHASLGTPVGEQALLMLRTFASAAGLRKEKKYKEV